MRKFCLILAAFALSATLRPILAQWESLAKLSATTAELARKALWGEALTDREQLFLKYNFVVTDSPEGLQLARGTVYSYYEFVNNIDQRLNDDEWRARIASGNVPPRPAWISAFFAP